MNHVMPPNKDQFELAVQKGVINPRARANPERFKKHMLEFGEEIEKAYFDGYCAGRRTMPGITFDDASAHYADAMRRGLAEGQRRARVALEAEHKLLQKIAKMQGGAEVIAQVEILEKMIERLK